jgi:NarL family two-component system response regulator LiaR
MTLEKIRVLVVDDHPTVRRGLLSVIRMSDDLECVGEASNGAEAIRLCGLRSPDVVLMDLMMPEIDGAMATKNIRDLYPNIRVLILTSFHEQNLVQSAIQAGAIGYLLKTVSAEELTQAIRAAHQGRRTLAPEATEALVQATQPKAFGSDLTEREREILALLAQGMTNNEISQKLFIAVPTVKFHITNLFSKMRVESRTEAVLAAIKNKLVDVT